MTAYYNEFDPFAAAWLRQLIEYGHIAPGIVDERSIEDITPADLAGFTQCHFFAGIGVWSYALRRAGWSDDTPIWTGSCPCQPFSAAGKGAGFDDERHLWPAFHWIIGECRPSIVIGEQVASADGLAWLDLIQSDLEIAGYASAAVDMCAAGIGAPHIRQRLYWMAVAERVGWQGLQRQGGFGMDRRNDDERSQSEFGLGRQAVGMDHTVGAGLEGFGNGYPTASGRDGAVRPAAETGKSGGMGDAEHVRSPAQVRNEMDGSKRTRQGSGLHQFEGSNSSGRPSPTNGFWRNADWLFCRDGKWRPVEPGTSPLVNRTPARMGRLRGYGNAIVAEQAQTFVQAVMDML